MIDTEKLENIYKPHLRGQLEQGFAVLFTGAGFSISAKNFSGGNVASTTELTKAYWDICYPGMPYDEVSELEDLFDQARLQHQKKLVDVSRKLLSVDHKSMPEWYKSYYVLPWSTAYTLNIDDFPESINRAFSLGRKTHSISASKSFHKNKYVSDSNHLNVIHLNGALDDLPNDVTFSTTQYATRLTNEDPWYSALVSELISRCFVFVGTQLDEISLWKYIELRAQRGPRRIGERRHRSYLVVPELSRAKQARLSQFNIVWLPFTAEQFATEILGEMRATWSKGSIAVDNRLKGTQTEDNIILLNELKINTKEKTEYLFGEEPRWSDVHLGRVANRNIDKQLYRTVVKSMESDTHKNVILFIGTPGSGKSSSIMLLASKLVAEGKRIGWVDRSIEISPWTILSTLRDDDKFDVLIIDDADIYGSNLSTLIRDIREVAPNLLIILEMRSYRVDNTINPTILGNPRPIEEVMPPLTEHDINNILDVLIAEKREGKLKGVGRAECVRLFKDHANSELVVAMYEITTGLKFKDKMIEELDQLTGVQNFIYAIVATATANRFDLTKDEIMIAVGDMSNSTLNEIETLLRRRVLITTRSDELRIRARHRRIASIVLDHLREQGTVKAIINGLIIAATAKVHKGMKRSSRLFRLLRLFINHDRMYRMMDLDEARELYSNWEGMLHWDYHYWLHRGALEVEWGILEHAENFLSQARGLTDDAPFVENEWAYLIFKKAIRSPGSLDATPYVEEATKILKGLVFSSKTLNPYSFHVLGSQGLAWSRRGIKVDSDRRIYLEDLLKILERGVQCYPQDEKLSSVCAAIKEEYLSQAIS